MRLAQLDATTNRRTWNMGYVSVRRSLLSLACLSVRASAAQALQINPPIVKITAASIVMGTAYNTTHSTSILQVPIQGARLVIVGRPQQMDIHRRRTRLNRVEQALVCSVFHWPQQSPARHR